MPFNATNAREKINPFAKYTVAMAKRNDQTFTGKKDIAPFQRHFQISTHRKTDLHARACELSTVRYLCFFIHS